DGSGNHRSIDDPEEQRRFRRSSSRFGGSASIRAPLSSTRQSGVLALRAHGGGSAARRGVDAGCLRSGVGEAASLPRRELVRHLAAPDDGQRGSQRAEERGSKAIALRGFRGRERWRGFGGIE